MAPLKAPFAVLHPLKIEVIKTDEQIMDFSRGEEAEKEAWNIMTPVDFKVAITEDIKEIELALSVLNGLRDVNTARLAMLEEAEVRDAGDKES